MRLICEASVHSSTILCVLNVWSPCSDTMPLSHQQHYAALTGGRTLSGGPVCQRVEHEGPGAASGRALKRVGGTAGVADHLPDDCQLCWGELVGRVGRDEGGRGRGRGTAVVGCHRWRRDRVGK